MNRLEKLLRKTTKQDRERLLRILSLLASGKTEGLTIHRLKQSRYYRIRVGRFRIIFSIDRKQKTIEIESVRLRDEGTHK